MNNSITDNICGNKTETAMLLLTSCFSSVHVHKMPSTFFCSCALKQLGFRRIHHRAPILHRGIIIVYLYHITYSLCYVFSQWYDP